VSAQLAAPPAAAQARFTGDPAQFVDAVVGVGECQGLAQFVVHDRSFVMIRNGQG
jgi:hypothetical protein